MFTKIEVDQDNIDQTKPPFDGKSVLIKTGSGIIEAWWSKGEINMGNLHIKDDAEWVCYDDQLTEEFESATHWAPLPYVE